MASLAVLLALPSLPGAQASAQTSGLDPSTLGMYPGNNKGDRFAQFERDLKRPIRHVLTMSDTGSPSAMRQSMWGQFASSDAYLPALSHRVDVIASVPVAFGPNGMAKTVEGQQTIRKNLFATAAGQHDEDFRVVARLLKNAGFGDAIIRLGGEFDGLHPPYSARNGNNDAFIAAFRHVRNVLKAESPAFRFEWTPMRASFVQYGLPAYPGNNYVDIIGMDIYWRETHAISDSDWNNQYLKALQAQRAFAVTNGKSVSYAEWARSKVDTTRFVDLMHGWFTSLPATGPGRLVYQSYFNPSEKVDVNFTPYDLNQLPKVKSRYLQLFGGAVSTPPTTTVPPTTVPPATAPPTTAPPTTVPPTTAPTTTAPPTTAPPIAAPPVAASWSVSGSATRAAISASIDGATMTLNWSHPKADRYIVKYQTTGSSGWMWIPQNTATSTSITGISATKGYTVEVIYISGANWQEWNTLKIPTRDGGTPAVPPTTAPPTTAPPTTAPPTTAPPIAAPLVAASWSVSGSATRAAISASVDGATMKLNWSHPKADRYIVKYQTTGSSGWTWIPQNTATSTSITGISATKGYTVEVIYISGANWQEWNTLKIPTR